MIVKKTATKSIKDENANDHKDNVVKFKEGLFGSVYIEDKKTFIWKKYDEDKYSNAVNAYIFWNNIKNTPEALGKYFSVKLSVVEKVINDFKKELKKFKIELYYDKKQGKWYDGQTHFVDYLWTDICNIVEKKNQNCMDVCFVMTDDIYVLRAMKNKSLFFQHNIPNAKSKKQSKYIKEIQECLNNVIKSNRHIIKEIKPKKITTSKSIEIIFK